MTATVDHRPDGTPPEALRVVLRRLSSAQKGAVGAPAYSRFVNRPFGRLLAALAYRAGLTPNAVTGISAVFTATGIALLALVRPSVPLGLVVAACLVLGYALDSADGQVARLRGGGSPAGEWLDHMVDAAKATGLHLGLVIGLYRFDVVETWVLLVPLGYCLVDAVTYFATMLNEALRAQHGVATRAQPTAQRAGVARSLLTLPTDYGLLACLFVGYGLPWLFVPAYAVLFLAAAGFLALASVKWFHEMKRLPR
ncbi:CDP-alcohol phosphatidyltransferase family protein [Blastococcus sp. VKM Ac-2987]|uniref:CDP-alcohol phosphatidyltransferase family protein n=1 Tax=Blastococcus sp. VKM Ac-2987 TaxID=3004141 RepID=UPI0022AB8510|nr:CDP-alcohol phosphatidyltransferase family protein [Blastococcus sp. VKM Ac-2987]MCZ2858125.1 CDP-alcohol phosphatidyltransferase family protein [Blastococcus sp. VKM Ac-2987]